MAIFERGTHFAGHRIVRLVRAGRVAAIYEIIAPDGCRRALKVLNEDIPLDAKLTARLAREGEVIATIDHPNVVGFHGADVEHGRVWILLELVDGPDLGTLAHDAGGALPLDRAVRLVRQACEGITEAHDRKIVHRELEPGHILVATGDVVKVAGFGRARFERWGVKTSHEQRVDGSPYMAPERWRGQAEPASDVYSMGTILYELASGANPFGSEEAPAYQMCSRHFSHEPPALATLGRDIPHDLSELVARTMAKDPAVRGTMRQLVEDLGAVLRPLTVRRRAIARNVPLPNPEEGMGPTEPAMPAFGDGGTMLMAAMPVPGAASAGAGVLGSAALRDAAPCEVASSRVARAAMLPPVPSEPPPTLRVLSRPPAAPTVAMNEVAPREGRASSGVPVEMQARPRTPARSRGTSAAVVGACGVVALGLLGVGWTLGVRVMAAGVGATPAEAAPVAATPSASASAARPHASATAAPRQHVAPQRKGPTTER